MKLEVGKIGAHDWETHCAEHAHLAVFNETMPPGFDRIDYAVVVGREAKPEGYITVRELDHESVYLKHGGAFDPLSKVLRLKAFQVCLDWFDARYKRSTTLVENTNVRYLKLAMTAGFVVIGVRNFQGKVLLELLRERKEPWSPLS